MQLGIVQLPGDGPGCGGRVREDGLDDGFRDSGWLGWSAGGLLAIGEGGATTEGVS